jgi:putative transposase
MSKKRKQHSSKFKAKVALTAVKSDKTLAQLSKEFSINPNVISKWKIVLISRACEIFESAETKRDEPDGELISELYQKIGEQKVKLDWLKKKSNFFN